MNYGLTVDVAPALIVFDVKSMGICVS